MAHLIPLPDFLDAAVGWPACHHVTLEHGTDIQGYTECLARADAALGEAFQSGRDVDDLVRGRAAVIDRLLIAAWRGFGLVPQPCLSLVAVGGYGRGELHPGSDVDILILHCRPLTTVQEEQVSRLVTFLWDIGLHPGHSVRTIDTCLQEAAADVTVATNLMESRLLAGDEDLYARMKAQTGPATLWPAREFFAAKLAEQKARHHRFGDTAYRLEPNLKEGPGGLRDIQMVGWVTKRHFGASSLHELVEHDFLTEDEYETLMHGQAFLWRVRFALHFITQRREDRLLFDQQRALARQFGYSDQGDDLAVEQFMQAYFRTVTELERLNEILLQHYQEALLSEPGDDEVVPINRRFQARRGFLEVTGEQVFRQYPPALLEVFLLLEQHQEFKGVRAATIRLIRSHRHLIDERFRNEFTCRALFMEILRQPHGVTRQLRRMNRYGVLAAYLPAFGMIVGRMQYDLFHIYTVDEHTLFVIRNLRRYAIPEHADELPHCSHVFKQIPKPELLYLAGLFHDIAKGRGGDHSEIGSDEARTFCLHHGLSSYDANLVAWLVKTHLLMSLTAQRRDISDPQVILEFANQVGNGTRLDYLYLLTVADIRGTNPTLWNSWKASLLTSLYAATQRVLRRGVDNPPDRDELVGEVQTNALELLTAQGVDADTCRRLWSPFDDEYFLRHSADEIAWHTAAIRRARAEDLPLVLIRQSAARGSTEIFLYADDHPNLFAHTTTALAQLGLDIVDARIITSRDRRTLDTFLVLEDTGQPIDSSWRLEEIADTLRRRLRDPDQRPVPVKRNTPRQLKHFDVRTDIRFAPQPRFNRTVLSITTGDRPGLLSRIGIVLTECGIRVHNAKIATAGEQADDIFYITDLDDRPLTDAARQDALADTLRKALQQSEDNLSIRF
ncbi:MAG: [protein-PII] uridylyltransferase [Chromatiales bacterium]|nr:[protein-PII] uridylyltransferase [Chromatiales bacterium]